MRELTKAEKKLFDIFIKGYCQGLKGVPINIKGQYLSSTEVKYITHDVKLLRSTPMDDDILAAYKDKVPFCRRTKAKYREFREGYISGYFRSLSSDKVAALLDPELNEDIYKYLQSVWLHSEVYGGELDAGSKQV